MKKILILVALALISAAAFAAKPAKKAKDVAFGSTFGKEFVAALADEYTGNEEVNTYSIKGVTVTGMKKGKNIVDKNNMIVCRSIQFVSASSGDAVLTIKARVAMAVVNKEKGSLSPKAIGIYRNGTLVDKTTLRNEDPQKYLNGTFDIKIADVKKGDEIKIACEGSGNHRIIEFSWNKAE